MNILITGKPGVGKTTLIKGLAKRLGKRAGGFYTEEIRKAEQRIGFKIKTLDGKTGILSSVDIDSPYRVGKYKVNLAEFERIVLPVIEDALAKSRIVIIDEIGPMELFSLKFKEVILRVLDAPNHAVATIKLKGVPWIEKIKSRQDVKLFTLRADNRQEILREILNNLS